MAERTAGSLAWPSHDAGPTPPPGTEAPDPAARPRRRPLDFWDRVKFLWLFAVIFAFLAWRRLADNPLVSAHDALRDTLLSTRVLQALFAVEVLRQGHYLVAERSARWYHFVAETTFGRWDRWVDGRDPWARYRAGRLAKAALVLAIGGAVLGVLWDLPWYQALFDAPSRIAGTLFDTAQGLPLIFNVLFIMMIAVGQFVAIFWFLSRGGVDVYRPQEVKTRFSDVWGQDPVLDRVKENIVFLENPKAIEDKGGYVPGGILLWGPPGTGKTLMAEAVAGETGRPFVFVDPGAFQAMFIGVGVLKVKSLFRKLRRLALRYGGVIVFFDEADSLGSRGGAVASSSPGASSGAWRGVAAGVAAGLPPGGSRFDPGCGHWASAQTRHLLHQVALAELGVGAGEDAPGGRAAPGLAGSGGVRGIIMGGMGMGGGGMGTLQALLSEMSGLKKPRGFLNKYVRRWLNMTPKAPFNYRILTMMATNLPDALDPALLRPGRIDRAYQVGFPSTAGRERTYRGYLNKISHDLSAEQVHRLAVISTRATGASIKDIVNEGVVIAIREQRDTVTYQDLIKAKHLKTHGPADDWTYSDWEGHAVAVHEACHAVAMYRLRTREAIDIATIERRGGTGGFVSPVPLEDQFVEWRRELEAEVMTFLASLAGERLFFDGDNSQGVGGDLRASTTIVMTMTTMHGMGETVASHATSLGLIGRRQIQMIEDGTDRQFLETEAGRRVEARLQELLGRVGELLAQDRHHVLAVAHALETHKTISGEDIVAVVEGARGPMVDGSVYHAPVARAELETYHAAVIRAMKEHSRVERGLPRLHPEGAEVDLVHRSGPDAAPRPTYPAGPPLGPPLGPSSPTPPTRPDGTP